MLLLAGVVGSGIMGDRLSGGNVAIALPANTLATGATLVAIILAFGPISGAHFNPVVYKYSNFLKSLLKSGCARHRNFGLNGTTPHILRNCYFVADLASSFTFL
jgi:hypothetical protein